MLNIRNLTPPIEIMDLWVPVTSDLLSFGGSYGGSALSVLKYDNIHDLLHEHFDFLHRFVATVAYA